VASFVVVGFVQHLAYNENSLIFTNIPKAYKFHKILVVSHEVSVTAHIKLLLQLNLLYGTVLL
jgi:hypothetical protein